LVAFQDSALNHPAQAIAINNSIPTMASMAAVPSAPVVPLKLNTRVGHATLRIPVVPARVHSARPKLARNNMVHLASSKTMSAPAAETLFVVIESGGNAGHQVYQIQMWRLTLHSADESSSKSPHRT
jgi:hypothetical protein